MLILDVRTLYVGIAIINLYTSLLLFLYSRQQKTYPGFGFWLIGNVLALCMYSLYILRGAIPDFFGIVLANSIGTLANVFHLEGMKKFVKGSSPWLPNFLLPIFIFIAHFYFLYIFNNLLIRDFLFSTFTILVVGRMSWLLVFETKEDIKPISLFFAALLLIFIAGTISRVVLWNITSTTNIFQNTEINSTSALFLMIFDISWSVCLILLNSQRMNSEISQLTGQLEQFASLDSLTGVYNRRKFLEIGAAELERSKRYGRNLSLLMFDLNNFKDVNDSYGHAAGDEVLKKVVEICRNSLRNQDSMGRFGGDEFVILMPETNIEAAMEAAVRLNAEVQNSTFKWDWNIHLSLSYGVASATAQDSNIDQLMHRADILLYEMKKYKKNLSFISST
ncbi:MAG TPA: GGDEF domain-containing protein [Anaerolineales bacterium]|nr:GGDEF domain-containing protein [Anaerolineales bacterium]